MARTRDRGDLPLRQALGACRRHDVAYGIQQCGFAQDRRGWNDFEQPMTNESGEALDADAGDELLASRLKPEQRNPK